MKTPEKVPDKSSNASAVDDDNREGNSEKKNSGRRLQDSLISKDPSRKFNVDRRTQGSERRVNTDTDYNGPARRNTIDRRLNLKDRRKKD